MIREPSWLIVALVGAVIGLLLQQIPTAVKALGRLAEDAPFEGRWYHYHFSHQGSILSLRTYNWDVSRGYRHRFRIRATPAQNADMSYHGYAYYEKDFVIVRLFAKRHPEEVMIRFRGKVPSKRMKVIGLSLAQDYDGKATSGVDVLCQNPLTEAEIRALIKKETITDPSLKLIRIK